MDVIHNIDDKLPHHLLTEIFIRVPVVEWGIVSSVSRKWCNLFQQDYLWYAAIITHFPLAANTKIKTWPGPIPIPRGRGLTKRRFVALYVSKRLFSCVDGEMDEMVGHTYLYLKDQLDTGYPSGILHGTIIDQFIACGLSREKADEFGSNIWLTVIQNLEDNEETFMLLKRLAMEIDTFLPFPYSRSYKVVWKVFDRLLTDFRDCFTRNRMEDYYDVLSCAKHKFHPIPSTWLGY